MTYDADEWMKKHPEIDVIAIGEGEQTFLALLQTYQEAKNSGQPPRLRDVAGIAYRDDEYVRFSMPRAQIEEMDAIPSPFVDHLDELNNRVVYFEASRGVRSSVSTVFLLLKMACATSAWSG